MLFNLLQRGFQPGANPGAGNAGNLLDNPAIVAVLIGSVCFGVVVLAVVYAASVLVAVRSSQALKEVRGRNRAMEPGLVWLSLIPVLGSFWGIYAALKTAESLAEEFRDRRLRSEGDGVKLAGMAYAILVAVCFGLFVASFIPLLGWAFSCVYIVLVVVQVVFGFVYASKLGAATQRLRRSSDDRDDEFDDDEPAPRRKPKKKFDDDFEEFDEPKGGR